MVWEARHTKAHWLEPVSPLSQVQGHDASKLIDELIPGGAAVFDDVIVGFEDAVLQPVVALELPHGSTGMSSG